MSQSICSDNVYYVYGYKRAHLSDHGQEGSFYYIGKGKGNRKTDKRHTVKPPNDASLIETIAENMSEKDALQLEMNLIFLLGRLDIGTGILRNKTDGGQGMSGNTPSETTKAAQSERRKRWISDHPEYVERLIERNTGVIFTEQRRKSMSERAMGRRRSVESREKQSNTMRGRKHSEETRRKIAETNASRWKDGSRKDSHRRRCMEQVN